MPLHAEQRRLEHPRGIMLVPGPTHHQQLRPGRTTFHQTTTDLYWQVRNLIVADAGECAADNLFQADRHQPAGSTDG